MSESKNDGLLNESSSGNNSKLLQQLKKIDFKFYLGFIVGVIAVVITYKGYVYQTSSDKGTLSAEVITATFFIPDDLKTFPQVQFEVYLTNSMNKSLSIRPVKGYCNFPLKNQDLVFYTNSNEMLHLEAGESKHLIFLSDFKYNFDYSKVNQSILNNFAQYSLYDFEIEFYTTIGTNYRFGVPLNDSTTSTLVQSETAANTDTQDYVQLLIISMPEERIGQRFTIEDNHFEKIEWRVN